MSQLGQHVQANENGQKAAAIAEIILIKTHEFCQMSIDELMHRDGAANTHHGKVKGSIIDHTVTDTQGNDSRDDYQGNASLKSSMIKQNRVRKLTRGHSVTSLYSQEKERKSVSIRRSRSKTNSMQGRASSVAANSDDTTQSLERMYTFNLSHMQKQANAKNGKGAKKDSPAGVPAGEDAIDIRPVDMKNKNGEAAAASTNEERKVDGSKASTATDSTAVPILGISKPSSSENPEQEETKGRQTERTRSQASRSMP